MAVTTYPTTAHETHEATTPVWRVGAMATIAGALVTEAFTLAARAADVPMYAADPGAAAAKEIPVGGFAMAVVMNAAIGVVLAVVIARKAKRPARTFTITAVALTALSLLGPVLATHTEQSTKVMLLVAHLVAAAIVIPPLTRRLAQANR